METYICSCPDRLAHVGRVFQLHNLDHVSLVYGYVLPVAAQ